MQVDKATPRSHRLFIENPISRDWATTCNDPSGAFKIIQWAPAVGCPQELDGKIILIKTAHTLV